VILYKLVAQQVGIPAFRGLDENTNIFLLISWLIYSHFQDNVLLYPDLRRYTFDLKEIFECKFNWGWSEIFY